MDPISPCPSLYSIYTVSHSPTPSEIISAHFALHFSWYQSTILLALKTSVVQLLWSLRIFQNTCTSTASSSCSYRRLSVHYTDTTLGFLSPCTEVPAFTTNMKVNMNHTSRMGSAWQYCNCNIKCCLKLNVFKSRALGLVAQIVQNILKKLLWNLSYMCSLLSLPAFKSVSYSRFLTPQAIQSQKIN